MFTDREMRERSNVVVVNEALAKRYFPGQDPLGKQVVISMTDPNVPTEIIGVVSELEDRRSARRHVGRRATGRIRSCPTPR